MDTAISPDERRWLASIVADLPSNAPKLVYADWLEEQGDQRAGFLRSYVAALGSMQPKAFPDAKGLPEAWLELVGFRHLEQAAEAGCPELKDPLLRLARPALRMKTRKAKDDSIPVGASKIGGLPDLPPGFAWPLGQDCKAIYNDDTEGVEELAGFVAQVDFGEIAETLVGPLLPPTGVLSIFCYTEMDNPDVMGVRAVYFDDPSLLVRTAPPEEPTEGNEPMPAQRLTFEETLDVPDTSGPWDADMRPDPDKDYHPALRKYRERNFENLFGYARGTGGDDPTRAKDVRHMVVLDNPADCKIHLQIPERELAARNFDALILAWVDFD